MTWPELIDAFSEYIPGYGMLYSLNRMVHAGRTDDGRAELKSAINLAQGVVRDAVLFSGAEVAAPIAVCMAIGDSVTDKIAIYGNPERSQGYLTKQACKDTLQRYKGNKEFRTVLHYRRAVYGKFTYAGFATAENFFLSFPAGLRDNGPCQIFTTFTTDANCDKKRQVIYVNTPMKVNLDAETFSVEPENRKAYSWYGTVSGENGKNITLEMKLNGDLKSTIHLQLQVNDTP